MHEVRRSVREAQADVLGLPLTLVYSPPPYSNEDRDLTIGCALAAVLAAEIERAAFGDLFLEDVRAYREGQICSAGPDTALPL